MAEEHEEQAVKALVEAVKKNGYHLTSGEVGLKQVFTALAEAGYSDVVYQMVMNPTAPSYRVFADNGLTTLPEYWNYEELWLGSMVRSRNHAMMGSCARMDDKLCVRASSAVTRMDKNVSGTVCRSRVDVCEGECYDPVGNCKGVMEKGE